uniref:Cytochrome b n=1 Tax=Didesmococcus koreanus TaxID=1661411 RepID=A0A891GZA2_9HEMI|nr:cytochrome b [Didesmococcus koreanus]QRK27461.1 cytochrome b [Didesmococcus koreanus]
MKNFFNVKTPSNIYLWWNFGSAILMMMVIQISSGVMISMNYISKNNMFDSSLNIYMNLNYGWMLRLMHSNITSIMFILILIHLSRSLMFKSFMNFKMWTSGISMLLLIMMESFIGYSLIWNQMSYWAMMVITNFISAIPSIGKKIIKIVWGNFNINIILINRFLSLHFIIPILIMLISLIHIMILHSFKSNNPLGITNKTDLINLNPNLIIKDMVLFTNLLMMLLMIIMIKPMLLSNEDNFVMMNYFKTPSHIEPEWYFMFFYSILRSINNKMSGLMMLMMSILMMLILPKINSNKFQSFNTIYKTLIVMIMFIIFSISSLSKKNVEFPFKELNITLIYLFFFWFFMTYLLNKLWNKMF